MEMWQLLASTDFSEALLQAVAYAFELVRPVGPSWPCSISSNR
jgi:hypothetical protein